MANARVSYYQVALLLLFTAGLFAVPAFFAFGQQPSSENLDGALRDLSAAYGHTVTSVDQAKAICNLEQYLSDCAEIGKRHGLYQPDELPKVDAVLGELKGKVIEDLKSCADESCLVDVAQKLSRQLADKNPSLARQLDLTPRKVQEKQVIIETAKEVGVNINECRAMDPDTASTELLRACAKLAKHERIQKYLPEEAKRMVESRDAAIKLQEGLRNGEYECGDSTLDGCGNFCLNPGPEARKIGVAAIPPICRTIAERFFGPEGVMQLEKAYTQVQQTADQYVKRVGQVLFTTHDGKTLTNPPDIGRYLEKQAKEGNVEAIERGMDFMVLRGFARPEDKDFALQMVRKVKDIGREIDFDECEANPAECDEFVPDEQRDEFDAMDEVHRIMNEEMQKRGVQDSRLCANNPQYGEACVQASRAALPRLSALAEKSPFVEKFIAELQQRVRVAGKAFEARQRVEEKFLTGERLSIGDQVFQNFKEMDTFCRTNGELCLAEAAKKGFVDRDYAAEKYERTFELRGGPYPGFVQPGLGGLPPGQVPGFTAPGPGFGQSPGLDKEDALKKFKAWLENPQGPPPLPTSYIQPGVYPQPPGQRPFPQYCPAVFPSPCPEGQYRETRQNTQGCFLPADTCTPIPGYRSVRREACPFQPDVACPAGSVRREFRSPEGCPVVECVFRQIGPPQTTLCENAYKDPASCRADPNCNWVDGENYCRFQYCPVNVWMPPCAEGQAPHNAQGCNVCDPRSQPPPQPKPVPGICPALPTVTNCSAGEEKYVTYSSPECGTYYGCRKVTQPLGSVTFPYKFTNGYTVNTFEEARAYCLANGPGSGAGIAAECEAKFGVVYTTTSACDVALTGLLGTGCHQMYTDSSGNLIFCDGPMSKSAKRGDTVTTPGCQSPTPTGPGCGNYITSPTCESNSACDWLGSSCVPTTIPPPTAPQCSDGIDNDLDAKIDYPADTGCYSSADTTETPDGTPTPTGSCTQEQINLLGSGCHKMDNNAYFDNAMTMYIISGTTAVVQCSTNYITNCTTGGPTTTAAQCSDGRDNDGDGLIDYPADTGCYGRDDNDEAYVSTTGYTCDAALTTLLGTGCHYMYNDSAGNPIFCNSGMTQSAKRGDTAATAGCQSPTQPPPTGLYEDSLSLCSDGIDNDRDGFIDRADPSCAAYTTPTGTAQCSDGRDNDGDGLIDYPADTGCYSATDDDETIPPTTTTSTCPSFAHEMSGYCMLNADTSRCADYPNAGTEANYTNAVCLARTTTTTTTTTTTCPSGQYWSGTACVSSAPPPTNTTTTAPPPVCSVTQVLDVTTNTCVAAPPPTCSLTEYFDPPTNTCKTNPTCSSIQVLDVITHTCVAAPPPTCTSPAYLDTATNTCVTPPPPTSHLPGYCPSNHYWDWNKDSCAVTTQYVRHFVAQVRTTLHRVIEFIADLLVKD